MLEDGLDPVWGLSPPPPPLLLQFFAKMSGFTTSVADVTMIPCILSLPPSDAVTMSLSVPSSLECISLHNGCLGSDATSFPHLIRQKRHWIIPALKVKENHNYPPEGKVVAKIRSDNDKEEQMFYSLHGPGANRHPVNQFVVEEKTGIVRVRGTLDREEIDTYIITGMARYRNGTKAEYEIELKFDVEDENDNPPVFADMPIARVNESSPAGTLVTVVNASDADKPNSINSRISYSIVKQEPDDALHLFYIHKDSGSIYVKETTLDREVIFGYYPETKSLI
ncbi:desmoglein-2-like [Thalassophryne amazonica]|uniref:desmoglein-2-like n=1 Tax=Thalassophryne amazonica TaxID=390379 RepID=UPI0014725269|nr:desmoglein-2-like [Thalassophryne amazonica]